MTGGFGQAGNIQHSVDVELAESPVKSKALLYRAYAANEQPICNFTDNRSGVCQFNA